MTQQPNYTDYGLRNLRNDQMTRFNTCATRATTESQDLTLAQPAQLPNGTDYYLRNLRNYQMKRFTACATCATTK
jgi:hypothetical protein